MSFTAGLKKQHLDERLLALRKEAKERFIPVTADETLNLLNLTVSALQPNFILEIGTAEGLSGIAMLQAAPSARLVTVELNEEAVKKAEINFKAFEVSDRVTQITGDAFIELERLSGGFDFVFLDGPKAQYVKYLPQLKRLLKSGGMLFADDVLLFGYVDGSVEAPKKKRSIVNNLRAYLEEITSDADFITSVIEVGEGVALSLKK